jgi:indole-3-glycerol phosphate synthase
MATILDKIIAQKFVEVAEQKKKVSEQTLLNQQRERGRYSLKASLLKPGASGIIAEFKRRSPSKDWINQNAVSTDIVPGYAQAGASGLSILTDEPFFGGTPADLISAAKLVEIPVLRKDFMVDEYQILEADRMGADVILLIAANLRPQRVQELARYAQNLNLEVLLEIHNHAELEHICNEVTLVGVNNRNLHTFVTDINTSVELSARIPDRFIKISESGLGHPAEVKTLKQHGYKGFLMGESFMKTAHPANALMEFIMQLTNK